MSDTLATIVDFPSSDRMTEAEYERERRQLRETYGDNSVEAAAKRDQAMALLFVRTGWTQEELAAKEGVGQQLISRRLRFGRFLNFTPTGVNAGNLPNNLTEFKFRGFWSQTDKNETNERIRFRAVHALILENVALVKDRRPKIGKQLVSDFADGKWHTPNTMAQRLGVEVDHVEATLHTMRALRGTYGANAERQKSGKGFKYRIFKAEKKISTKELIEKLTPIIEELMIEGRKNAATAAPRAVFILAGNLQRLLDEWSE